MKRVYTSILATIAVSLATSSAIAQPAADTGSMRAKAALSLYANSRATPVKPEAKPTVAAKPTYDLSKPLTSMEAAIEVAKTNKCVVMLSIGLDCTSLCAQLRPELPTAHVSDVWGSKEPQIVLIYADRNNEIWRSGTRWTAVPTEMTIRQAAEDLKAAVDRPRQSPVYKILEDNCPNGNCPKPYFPMPRR